MKQTAVEWLVNRWKKLQSEQEKMTWNQIIQITELAKEMEEEQKYSIDFIMWYSGMDKDKIENAHKRWINETFKSE
jgi:hypothetical protein